MRGLTFQVPNERHAYPKAKLQVSEIKKVIRGGKARWCGTCGDKVTCTLDFLAVIGLRITFQLNFCIYWI